MARSIWKGAISFGLVHIPVALVSATSSDKINFDWLDDRSMEPVGYKRVNKVTGKEVIKDHIVKGIEYEKGQYVLLSEKEIKAAHPVSTQTIDIFAFIRSSEIPLAHIETPYYLAPDKRGEKVYALLRETLTSTDKVALANVILHTKQHLAAVMAVDSVLMLVMLRWPSEVRGLASLDLSKSAIHAELTKAEKDMARRLVNDMTATWNPDEYHNTFQEKIMSLVDQKVRDGKIEQVETDIAIDDRHSKNVIDLTELLKRSLNGKQVSIKSSATKSKTSTKAKATPIVKPESASKIADKKVAARSRRK